MEGALMAASPLPVTNFRGDLSRMRKRAREIVARYRTEIDDLRVQMKTMGPGESKDAGAAIDRLHNAIDRLEKCAEVLEALSDGLSGGLTGKLGMPLPRKQAKPAPRLSGRGAGW